MTVHEVIPINGTEVPATLTGSRAGIDRQVHSLEVTEAIGGVIAQGVASGEFEATDIAQAAMCTCHAMVAYFHPQMIAQAQKKPHPEIDQMVDFVLVGLAARKTK